MIVPWAHDKESRSRSDATYRTSEYRRNRPLAMKRDRWHCQIRYPGTCIGAASECDHIIPVTQGGGSGLDNLRAACSPCHKRKTGSEGGGWRRTRAQRDAIPADPAPRPATNW